MVEVRPQRAPQGAPSPDPRSTRNAAKKARLAAIRKNMEVPRVRVLPANDEIRRVLRHPFGMAFRSTGSVDWPKDSFTHKRLMDGSITLEQEPQPPQPQPPKPPPPRAAE